METAGREISKTDAALWKAYHAKNCAQGAPTEIFDAEGHRVEFRRDNQRNLERLLSPSGHNITFKYDGDRIIQLMDDSGNVCTYTTRLAICKRSLMTRACRIGSSMLPSFTLSVTIYI